MRLFTINKWKWVAGVWLLAMAALVHAEDSIVLRAWGTPHPATGSQEAAVARLLIEEFTRRHPGVTPVAPAGLEIPGRSDVTTLMQIAGDVAPDVLYVNFRSSDTYIRNDILYPLDRYIETSLGLTLTNSHLLSTAAYVEALKESPLYEREVGGRVPPQLWPVIRRRCPHGADCPYVHAQDGAAAEEHYHVWAWPQGPLVIALFYRKDLFLEAGLPDRTPETMEEMLAWARVLTDPARNRYGLGLGTLGWDTLSFLYSHGGRVVEEDENGEWQCVFDTEEAVEAYLYVARLLMEPFVSQRGETLNGVAYTGFNKLSGDVQAAMFFTYIDQRFFAERDPAQYGFGPVPLGPDGVRGSEFNAMMTAIYAGIEDPAVRDAAWEYIRFFDGPDARRMRATFMVESGLGRFVQPALLREAGFEEYVRQVPAAWVSAFDQAMQGGIPEPYGQNCQMVYQYVSQAIDQIRVDNVVRDALRNGDLDSARARIAVILSERVAYSNEQMLNRLPEEERGKRRRVAYAVTGTIILLFVMLFRKVLKTFSADQRYAGSGRSGWNLKRYGWAYLLLVPAAGSIALWAYYPLARGTLMAFQSYGVRGISEWVGIDNFASVLFSGEFWHSMWISLKYAVLFGLFGFGAPIALALLLSEVPRGKMLYRLLYYLPAVLSGVTVIFLWRSFYGEYGLINTLLNHLAEWLQSWFGMTIGPFNTAWFRDPNWALISVLLPVIWVGMGPGCLIYLAALKTIPDEMYEAADLDGAGVFDKVRHIALPYIKSLVLINFIGVMVGTVKGGSEFVLAMTQGGPYTPYGQTEVIGLRIYWEAFGYLRFGTATAMAWVLGSMLIGFTVWQMQRLSRMEFRSAADKK